MLFVFDLINVVLTGNTVITPL